MAVPRMNPDFKKFLECLDTSTDENLPLCSMLELTLFGCYVPPEDPNVNSSELSGFLTPQDSSGSENGGTQDAPSPSGGQPSRFTWRNSVSSFFSR